MREENIQNNYRWRCRSVCFYGVPDEEERLGRVKLYSSPIQQYTQSIENFIQRYIHSVRGGETFYSRQGDSKSKP